MGRAGRDGIEGGGHTLARGCALFFGVFSLANALVTLGTGRAEDLWWIDLRFLPPWLALPTSVTAAGLLFAYAVRPVMSARRRALTAASCLLLAAFAVVNAVTFHRVVSAGLARPAVPVPLSVPIALAFASVGRAVWRGRTTAPTTRQHVATALTALALAALFPLAQIATFGTTDYRREADVAVVLGAKVHGNGALSTSLEDRVRTGARLYRDGVVGTLLMSGGVGASGVDETVAMRERAIQLGVPAEAILLDGDGRNTDATVAGTTRVFRERGHRRVLVVSQFYHLPRIKLAYRSAGWEVRTVPAEKSRPIVQTPALVAREVPAFWVYWWRALLRDLWSS